MFKRNKFAAIKRSQIKKLIEAGLPSLLNMSNEEYRKTIPEPPAISHSAESRFPYLVLVEPRLTLKECMTLTNSRDFLPGYPGVQLLDQKECVEFSQTPYWICCNNGEPYLGESVESLSQKELQNERWLTATEGVFLAFYYPHLFVEGGMFCVRSKWTDPDGGTNGVIVVEPSQVGLSVDWVESHVAAPNTGGGTCAWPPEMLSEATYVELDKKPDFLTFGDPRLVVYARFHEFTCAQCHKKLDLEYIRGAMITGEDVTGEDAMREVAEKLLSQPYACTSCMLNFCASCAMEAAEERNEKGYCCPRCGGKMAEEGMRSVYVGHTYGDNRESMVTYTINSAAPLSLVLGCVTGKDSKEISSDTTEITTHYHPFTLNIDPTSFHGFDDPQRRERVETFHCPFCNQEIRIKADQTTLVPVASEDIMADDVLREKVLFTLSVTNTKESLIYIRAFGIVFILLGLGLGYVIFESSSVSLDFYSILRILPSVFIFTLIPSLLGIGLLLLAKRQYSRHYRRQESKIPHLKVVFEIDKPESSLLSHLKLSNAVNVLKSISIPREDHHLFINSKHIVIGPESRAVSDVIDKLASLKDLLIIA